MLIWLIQRSEPTPEDLYGQSRLLRTGMLAKQLISNGHDVVWWTSTFDHQQKVHRYKTNTRVELSNSFSIQYIRGLGYKRNVSIARFLDNVFLAKNFKKALTNELMLPDIILASIPTVELAFESIQFAKLHRIPVVLDVRDLWPDSFFDVVPPLLHPFVHLISLFMKEKLGYVFKRATGVVGITDPFVDWGVAYARRERNRFDKKLMLGYIRQKVTDQEYHEADMFWNQKGILTGSNCLNVVYFGVLGKVYDFKPVFEAARILKRNNITNIKFIICGDGEYYSQFAADTIDLDNVVLAGWVDKLKINALLARSHVGLAPYLPITAYVNTVSNKIAEYLSEGLPVALSLNKGELYDLLRKYDCGIYYDKGAAALADGLIKLNNSKSLIHSKRLNALKLFNDQLDGDKVYNMYQEHLEHVVTSCANKKHDEV